MLRAPRPRRSALVFVVSVCCATASSAFAGSELPGQPYASYWFPSTILDWDPATDPDAPFNRASVPLASRFSNPDFNVNPHAHLDEARVQALVAFAPTSFNPSQGSATEDYYALNYWQYIDQLVFWGGSAGEGLILAPNPTVIDAAHRNGVPVLGNVYLPPTAFGGQIDWVHDFVQRDGDTFPVADKMIEAAEYYGFDGWFINQETAGGDAQLANDMRDMLEYFHAHSNLLITWYDAMTATGAINWQNALTAQNQMFFQDGATLVSDEMFLNFNWNATRLANSATLATSLGRSPYELYAGIDVEANGYNTAVGWSAVFPEGSPHVTSIGFYRPEWTHNSAASVADFYARDNRFWIGPNGDPSDTTSSSNWKGVANYVPANSPLTELPWATNFNTGQGTFYAMDGEIVSTESWNNLSLQDVLPTWRWIVHSEGTKLTPSIDFGDAYWGGSSLLISGTLDAVNDVPLFETNFSGAIAGDVLRIIYKSGQSTGPTHLQAALAFADAPTTWEYLDVGDNTSAGWTTLDFDLGPYTGRTIAAIGLRIVNGAASEPYSMRIGRIAVMAFEPNPNEPLNLRVLEIHETSPNTATVRIAWDGDPVRNTYAIMQGHGSAPATWLGGTGGNGYYFIGHLVRDGNEAQTSIGILAVNREFNWSGNSLTVTWDHVFADGFDPAQ